MSEQKNEVPTLAPLSFPLHGSRLIEASAGTGKTFTIAMLYVRLVLGHGDTANGFSRPLDPPEILVVTFTDAASQELRDRIRQRLSEAAQYFLDKEKTGDALLSALRAEYPPEHWADNARRLQLAGEWMDEAAVSTIHSWCYRMLREHAFDSGSLFNLDLQQDLSELLAEVVRDYWRRNFYGLDQAQASVIAGYFDSPEALQKDLSGLLSKHDAQYRQGGQEFERPTNVEDLLEDPVAWNKELGRLDQDARDTWRKDRQDVEQLLHDMRGQFNGNSYKGKNVDATFQGWLDALAQWSSGRPAPDNLGKFGQTRFNLNGGKEAAQHAAFRSIDALFDYQELQPDIRAPLLLHALHAVRDSFDAELRRRAQLGNDELLTRLDEALRGPSGERLAQTIREQYPVAMIDEFQDTDPLQYRMFDSIYRINKNAEDCGLFMIGDPKQAIYSFRGADIHTYLKARTATEGRHYTLAKNFRSTQAMVDATNRCFDFAEEHEKGAFCFKKRETNPLPFIEVKAKGRDDQLIINGEPQPALTFWNLPSAEKIKKPDYLQTMAEGAASAIQSWLDTKSGFASGDILQPLQPADIAILVRDRNEAAAMRKALSKRKLLSVYLSDRDSLFASEQAKDMLYLLRACADPDDNGLLRTALATGSLGQTLKDLERLNSDELFWEEQVLRFRVYHKLWQKQGALPMLRKLLADYQLPARLLKLADGARCLTNLLHLTEWLQRSASEVDGEHALIRLLAEQLADSDNNKDEEILRLESDAKLIRIVTVHKSKGLEYPLVLLPFLCTYKVIDGKNKSPAYHDDAGKLFIELAPRPEKKDRRPDDAWDKVNDERLSEDLRLLYVALTRARYATWVGMAPLGTGNGNDNGLKNSAIGYLLDAGNQIKNDQVGEKLKILKGDCTAIQIEPPPEITTARYDPPAQNALGAARQPARSIPANWWIASYSALAKADDKRKVDDPDAPAAPAAEPVSAQEANMQEEAEEAAELPTATATAVGFHAFPRGAEPGTFLHDLLEWAGKPSFQRTLESKERIKEIVEKRCKGRGWGQFSDSLSEWLLSFLSMDLGLHTRGASLAGLRSYQVEMEFWFASHQVNVARLDKLVSQHTFAGLDRPALKPVQLNGMFKGFIDLIFEHDGRYYVADYKSNALGKNDAAYDIDAMRACMLKNRYDMQLCLYLLALHRQLKRRLPGYDYDKHIGGGLYIFMRGYQADSRGLLLERPPRELIEQMDSLFTRQNQEVSA